FFTKLLLFALALGRLRTHFFVVLLERRQIFTRFREFTFFHTFTDVPVNERTLGVHQIKLVINARKHFGDRARVRDHAHGTLHTSKITTWYDSRRLVVDTALETRWAPVDKLDRSNAEFVISATDNCSWYAFSAEITGAYELNMKWIRGYGTKLVWNSVTSTFNAPSKRNDAVNDEITCAIKRFKLVDIRVFKQGVRREHRVVRLDDRSRHLWRRVDGEPELTLAAVVDRETLKEKRTKSRTGTAADSIEHKETLETRAVVSQLTDAIEHEVDDFLADRVVTTRVVVGRIFLA
uniref:Secreted protein n=1 Tax=Globisporangium ultimum (strain ATCC 200006 / CBS 805.95 / DAOM BR144) TaxID=431595 RepID=K3X2W1_GLOUD